MRLTLRTLLAYLDDVLDSTDARELGKKVKESEVASGLVHRIRSVTRKLRLGAPKLSGKGMGLDANTVAEYLDSTLAQDRVPDFERICIESDVHLAEVASCHQILTLVLGEPADVDPALRERIQTIHPNVPQNDSADAGEPGGPEPASPEPASPEPASPEPASPEPASSEPAIAADAPPLCQPPLSSAHPVQDDVSVDTIVHRPATLEPSIRVVPIAATLLATFALALVAMFMMGPLDRTHPVIGRFFAENSAATADTSSPDTKKGQATPHGDPNSESPTGGPRQTSQNETDNGLQSPVTPTTPAKNVSPPIDTTPPPAESDPVAREPDAATTGHTAPMPSVPAPDSRLAPDNEPVDSAESPMPSQTSPESAEPDANAAPAADHIDDVAPVPGNANEEPLLGVGRYTSDQHVLAQFDAASGSWFRLKTLSPLKADKLLVALPTYRPRIQLTPGIQLVLIGPAAIQLREINESGIPGITVHYGRLLAVTDGKSSSALQLRLGHRESRVSFADADSMLALEVRPYLPPGSDPEAQPAHMLIRVFASTGRLGWHDLAPSNRELAIERDQCADMVDNSQAEVHNQATPDWIGSPSMSLIDRDASTQLEPSLDFDRPLSVALQEHISDRRVEVRSLAIRCVALFDQFDPFVNALNQPDLRRYWKPLRHSLEAALARSPESAALVRATLKQLRGADGTVLFRLLWGYSSEQLRAGAGEQLVEHLTSPSMDIRVLAYENLVQITQKTNLFRPDRGARQQKRAISNWLKTLREGEIVYKVAPPQIPESTSFPPTSTAEPEPQKPL